MKDHAIPVEDGWIQTASGRKFYPLEPRQEDIDPYDIAASLSRVCRYSGHSSAFYSVAQHCVLVSRNVPPDDAMAGLLHDAAEAYIGDMVRPLKQYLRRTQGDQNYFAVAE